MSSPYSPGRKPLGTSRARRASRLLAALVLVVTAVPIVVHQASPAAAADPNVVDIGAISPFPANSTASSANDVGTVVGSGYDPSAGTRAFRYTAADGVEDIGALPGAGGAIARDVNDAGVIVGNSGSKAFRWTRTGGMQDLGSLPGVEGYQGSNYVAVAINESGMVAGYYYGSPPGSSGTQYKMFTWTAGEGMREVPTPGHDIVTVVGLNDAGTIVGSFLDEVSPGRMQSLVFRWSQADGLRVLNPDFGAAEIEGRVSGINSAGAIVGTYTLGKGVDQVVGVYRWTEGGGVELLGEPRGDKKTLPDLEVGGIADDGTIYGVEPDQVGFDDPPGNRIFASLPGGGFRWIDTPPRSENTYATVNHVTGNGTVVGSLSRPANSSGITVHTAFVIPRPALDGEFVRVDGEPATVRKGATAQVDLRVDNTSGESLSGLEVVSVWVEPVGAEGGDAELTGTSGLDSTSLSAGASALAGFDLEGIEAGPVRLVALVQATGSKGVVSAEINTEFAVDGDDLSVEVTLDPPVVHSADRVPGEPASVGITVKVSNGGDDDVTNVTLQDLNVSRVFSGQQLLYDFVDPGPVGAGQIAIHDRPGAIDPVALPDVAAHDSITLRARVEIATPGAFEVSAMVWGRGLAPTTLVAVGKAGLTIESGLTIELAGSDGPAANLVDVVATITNSSGEKIDGLDWGDGLGLEVLAGSRTLELRSGPSAPLPTSLNDGDQVKVRWRFEVWDVGVAVSTLAATGRTAIGIDVEAVGELSSRVTADDLSAADVKRSANLALSGAIDNISRVAEGLEAKDVDPPASPGDQLRSARYQSYLNEGFSDTQAKILADVSVQGTARERYLVAFADGMDRRATELGDKFLAEGRDLYGLLSDPQRRNAAGSYLLDALSTNAGYLGDAFVIPDALPTALSFYADAASNAATSIQQAAVGQAELWRLSDQLYRDDPMGWATSTGQRQGALMSDFNAAFTTELVSTGVTEGGAAALKAVKKELGAGIAALRASTVTEAGGAGTAAVRAGGDDALGAATRQFAEAETQVKRFQELDYGTALSRTELEQIGGFSAADADAIDGIVAGVKDKFGVDIEMVARTAEPLSTKVPNGIGKRAYTKEKAVGELDKLLGAPDELGGRVTIFEPKPLPESQLAALEAREPGFTVRYQDRLKTQQKNWDALQSGNSKTGRLVEASQKYDGITIVQDLPGNPTQGVEFLEQLSDPSYVSSRGWTPEYAETLRAQLDHHPTKIRAKLGFEEVDGAFSVVDTIDGTVRPIVSDYDLQAVLPTGGSWPAGMRGQIETFVKAEMDRIGRSGRHGWSAAANDLPSTNFDLAAEFIMNTAHPSVARQTAENLAGRFQLLAQEFRNKAARLAADDPARAQLLAKAADFEELTVDKILDKWKPGEKTIVFSKGRVTVGSGEGSVP